jgi:hypothetical protein
MRRLLTYVCGFVLLLPLHGESSERIEIKISPRVVFAPADLRVRTSIESHASNRSLEIVAESADFYMSSQVELDGDLAPKTREIVLRGLPAGEYTLSAIVRDATAKEVGETRTTAKVLNMAEAMP